MQLNYSTNIYLLIPWFMKSLCVITIKLNTPTDVRYQWRWVGHLFTYVKTCERGRVNAVRSSCGPQRLRYNGVTVYQFVSERKKANMLVHQNLSYFYYIFDKFKNYIYIQQYCFPNIIWYDYTRLLIHVNSTEYICVQVDESLKLTMFIIKPQSGSHREYLL